MFKTKLPAKLRENKLDRERPYAYTRPGSSGRAGLSLWERGTAWLGKSAARSRAFLGLALEEGEGHSRILLCLLTKAREKKQPGGRQRYFVWGVMVGTGQAGHAIIPVPVQIQ